VPAVRELHYRVGAPALGHFPGHHRSTRGNSGFELRGHAPLLEVPDARRLDLNASLRDPFGNWIVRVYSQRKALAVMMVADLSASMGFVGRRRKLDVLAAFVDSLAWSASRIGDSFGFVGCDTAVREDLLLPPTRSRGAGAALARTLRALHLEGHSARALSIAHRHLPRQRALVFLVSDFHLPLPEIQAVIASLAHHDLVPVVIWDQLEFTLVCPRDADPASRRVSILTPLGLSFLGCAVGAVVRVPMASGHSRFATLLAASKCARLALRSESEEARDVC